MCIIIAVPDEKIIPEATLFTCWEANPDGAGYMFADGKNVTIKKGFMDFDSFIADYNTLDKQPHILHFRIATHGNTNPENTHPFRVSDKLAFAHNGIINGVSNAKDDMSDTWHFNEEYLKPIYAFDSKFYEKKVNVRLLERFIGGSKLAFLNNRSEVVLFNGQQGVWDKGIWYSNSSYKEKKNFPFTWKDDLDWKKSSKTPSYFQEGEYIVVNSGTSKGERGIVDEVGWASVKCVFHTWDEKRRNIIEKIRWMMPHMLTPLEDWE